MKQSVKLWIVKGVYILGVILDGLCAIEMLTGAILGDQSPFLGLVYSILGGSLAYQYAMFIAGIFMLGWTFILLWGLFKPIDRRGTLLITWIPVVVGLGITHILAYSYGLYDLTDLIIRACINGILNIVFPMSYILAKNVAKTA
jgi:hypothetical protein